MLEAGSPQLRSFLFTYEQCGIHVTVEAFCFLSEPNQGLEKQEKMSSVKVKLRIPAATNMKV